MNRERLLGLVLEENQSILRGYLYSEAFVCMYVLSESLASDQLTEQAQVIALYSGWHVVGRSLPRVETSGVTA